MMHWLSPLTHTPNLNAMWRMFHRRDPGNPPNRRGSRR